MTAIVSDNNGPVVHVDEHKEFAKVIHADCPYCSEGNLYHQVGLGIVHGDSGEKVAVHQCSLCKETTNLPDGHSYPEYQIVDGPKFRHIDRTSVP